MDYESISDEQLINTPTPTATQEAEPEIVTTEVPEVESDGVEKISTQEADDSTDEDTESDETDEEDADTTDDSVDEINEAKAQLDLLFAPLTANGKEMKIDNIDDARRLMQMGLGFNKKMAALKPHLKMIKMLENNGLLDESKLSFLIDINKKDPKAIGKLLADSEIDPLNLAQGNDYTPNTYSVSDSELELNSTLETLQESKHYGQLLDVVVNKWDSASKELLISNPKVIEDIHEHMVSGIYAQVTAVMEKERALGRLLGLSDLAAYKQVGDDMNARGMFATKAVATPPAATVNPTTTVKADESALKSRKLAASPTKSKPSKQTKQSDFNPLTATDEEIANMTLDKFI